MSPLIIGLYNLLVISGVNVSATSSDMKRVAMIVTGMLLMNSPEASGIMMIGMNARTVVAVALMIGQPISEAPIMDASRGEYP